MTRRGNEGQQERGARRRQAGRLTLADIQAQQEHPTAPAPEAWRMARGPAQRLLSSLLARERRASSSGVAQGLTLADLEEPLAAGLAEEAWRTAAGPAQTPLAAVRAATEAARRRTPIAVSSSSRPFVSRRTFILSAFWTGLGLTIATALGGLDFLFPRKIEGFGGPIAVAAEQVPKPGDPPIHFIKGKFWLVNLKPGEGIHGEFGLPGQGGLLALWQKCPHLGCTIPWRQDFPFGGVTGWFRCPCHGSTYTKAGIRVFGPSPRPMDMMAIENQPDGSIIVQTGQRRQGANNNAQQAEPYA